MRNLSLNFLIWSLKNHTIQNKKIKKKTAKGGGRCPPYLPMVRTWPFDEEKSRHELSGVNIIQIIDIFAPLPFFPKYSEKILFSTSYP